MRIGSIILITLFTLALLLGMVTCSNNYDKGNILKWHRERGQDVSNVERRLFFDGPYLISKNRRIYKVTTIKNEIFWWRCGNILSNDVIEELPNGEYKTWQ